jgi:hypothetical protein
MRMWMVDPRVLCRQHLLGEHGELHKHRASFVRGHKIDGRRGQIEPEAMGSRHDELAAEMLRRGYQHRSPYVQPNLDAYPACLRFMRVDRSSSLTVLLDRCPRCRQRWTAMRLALAFIATTPVDGQRSRVARELRAIRTMLRGRRAEFTRSYQMMKQILQGDGS